MDSRSWNVLSLCSGGAGLELGLGLAVENARTICYVEREAYAAEVLASQIEAGWLDDAPVWSDLSTFDGAPWRGLVDCVSAGFPCQPVSVAGGRRGQEDERWLWPDVARVVRETEPGWVFLENVPGLLVQGMGDVLRDLAEMGYAAEWGVFSAAGVGAPHLRERVFVLANTTCERNDGAGPTQGWGQYSDGRRGLANANEQGLEGTEQPQVAQSEDRRPDADPAGPTGRLADSNERELRAEQEPQPGCFHSAVAFPPGPSEREAWAYVTERWPWLAPAVATQPGVRRMADGLADRLVSAHRVDRLRLLGNGVVPLTAAIAFCALYERLTDAE